MEQARRGVELERDEIIKDFKGKREESERHMNALKFTEQELAQERSKQVMLEQQVGQLTTQLREVTNT